MESSSPVYQVHCNPVTLATVLSLVVLLILASVDLQQITVLVRWFQMDHHIGQHFLELMWFSAVETVQFGVIPTEVMHVICDIL